MNSLLLTYIILYPVALLTLLTLHPDSAMAQYLKPRLLREPRYPKAVLRQAGTAWILLGLWIIIAPFYFLQVISVDSLKSSGVLTALFAFVFPVTGATLTLAGILHLCKGIFSRSALAAPGTESIHTTDPAQGGRYLRRLSAYLRINLAALVLTVGSPFIEAAFGLEPAGWVVLTNVSLLITFILTIHRLRFYTARCIIAMGLHEEESLLTALPGGLKIVSFWVRAFRVEKLAVEYQRRQADRSPEHHSDPSARVGSR